MRRIGVLLLACAAGLTLLLARGAAAESGLLLAYPETFGRIPAATYDVDGRRVGTARLLIEKLAGGGVRLFSESGVEGGARTIASAELEPVADGEGLRLRLQESRSFDVEGSALGRMRIDHEKSLAYCTDPSGELVDRVELPARDHIANVPFNLLFLPLVRGDVDSVAFQFLLCRGGGRVIDFEAHVARRENGRAPDGELVEVRYGPRFGRFVSLLAQRLVPRLSVWFDPTERTPWIGHRLPLYSKGPEVFVVRDGVPTERLADPPD